MSPSPAPAVLAAQPDALVIRSENPFDAEWIEHLHEVSFGPGRFARAAFRVRERFATDPGLNAIAEIGGERAASVRMTPVGVGGVSGYLLGPLMTDPAFRKQGAGRSLVRHVCALALERPASRFVLLVGDRAYYEPLGFAPTIPHAIRFPGPVDPSRVLVFSAEPEMAGRLAGEVGAFGAAG